MPQQCPFQGNFHLWLHHIAVLEIMRWGRGCNKAGLQFLAGVPRVPPMSQVSCSCGVKVAQAQVSLLAKMLWLLPLPRCVFAIVVFHSPYNEIHFGFPFPFFSDVRIFPPPPGKASSLTSPHLWPLIYGIPLCTAQFREWIMVPGDIIWSGLHKGWGILQRGSPKKKQPWRGWWSGWDINFLGQPVKKSKKIPLQSLFSRIWFQSVFQQYLMLSTCSDTHLCVHQTLFYFISPF